MDDVYKLIKEETPETYGYFGVEPLETITDLASKIFVGGISIDEIVEDDFICCDPFGDKLLSHCLS